MKNNQHWSFKESECVVSMSADTNENIILFRRFPDYYRIYRHFISWMNLSLSVYVPANYQQLSFKGPKEIQTSVQTDKSNVCLADCCVNRSAAWYRSDFITHFFITHVASITLYVSTFRYKTGYFLEVFLFSSNSCKTKCWGAKCCVLSLSPGQKKLNKF